MENYERMYKEALSRARVVNPGTKDHNIVTTIFPELKESEDEKMWKLIKKYVHSNISDTVFKADHITRKELESWLEKQGKQEQLYIRFGEIPTDEISKIYRGEIEVGTENGVSVYPAFKTDEGDIVLGLSLPITKTTLYTQQQLIEYGDRPCYLVRGDYVGKDTDGQPLINNISIIEKIDSYRVKEEKQDKQNSTEEVVPKFKVGDFIINEYGVIMQIDSIDDNMYIYHVLDGNVLLKHDITKTEESCHLWTIQGAKDGDVLYYKSPLTGIEYIVMSKGINGFGNIDSYFRYNSEDGFGTYIPSVFNAKSDDITPATKEQRDLLFQKMKEAGYEWDSDKKELIRHGQ